MFTRTLLTTVAVVAVSGIAFAQTSPTAPSTAPKTSPSATTGGAAGVTTTGPLATETLAKTKLEASGYTGVKDLKKNADGSWSAKAMKDNKEMAVSIDAKGNVMSR